MGADCTASAETLAADDRVSRTSMPIPDDVQLAPMPPAGRFAVSGWTPPRFRRINASGQLDAVGAPARFTDRAAVARH